MTPDVADLRGGLKCHLAAPEPRDSRPGWPSPVRRLVAMVRPPFGASRWRFALPRPALSWPASSSWRSRPAADEVRLEPPPDPGARPGSLDAAAPRDAALADRDAERREPPRTPLRAAEAALHPRPAALTHAPMHHFAYRNGVLHAEGVRPPRRSRMWSARRSTAIPPPPWSGITASSRKLSPDTDALVCYAMKANSNQAVLATLAALGAGMDIVSGGRAAPGPRGRRPGRADRVLRGRQDPRRDGRRPRPRRSSASTSSRSPSSRRSPRSRSPAAARRRSRSASIRMSTPGPTPRSRPAGPRTSSGSRSPAPGRSTPGRPRSRASG